jgi:hypothetical protein
MTDASKNFITPQMLRAIEEIKREPSEHDLWRARVGWVMGAAYCTWDEAAQALARQGIEEPKK